MKVGIIGTGKIAQTIAKDFMWTEKVNIHAVYSRKKETAQTFASAYSGCFSYIDLDEMLLESDIDIVYIASPNYCHYEHIKKAIIHGKHVLCEKPMVIKDAQLLELMQLADDHKVILMEAMTVPFMPNYQKLKSLIKENDVIITNTQIDITQYSQKMVDIQKGSIPNVFHKDIGGGALLDLGVYALHFLCGLFGFPQQVTAYLNTPFMEAADTSGRIILQYARMQAIVTYGKDSVGKPGVRLQSTQGYFEIEGLCSRCNSLVWQGKEEITYTVNTDTNHHRYELLAFLELIQTNNREMMHEYLVVSRMVCQLLQQIKETTS